MPIEAIIFDFGGVLMRTKEPLGRREWESRLGLPAGDLERTVHGSGSWIKAQRGQITPDQYWLNVVERLGISADNIPALRHAYFRDDQLDQDLVTLLRSYRQQGFKTGLLSNDVASLADKLERELRIADAFDEIVISAVIGMMKPDPEAYHAILNKLEVAASNAIFVDDNLANIDAAAYLGLHAIRYTAGMDVSKAIADIIRSQA